MAKFLEFQIEGKNQFINIDHIAVIRQLGLNETEITLLSPYNEKGDSIFTINYPPYGELRYHITELDRLINKVAIITTPVKKS
jgi:hypothetical protein